MSWPAAIATIIGSALPGLLGDDPTVQAEGVSSRGAGKDISMADSFTAPRPAPILGQPPGRTGAGMMPGAPPMPGAQPMMPGMPGVNGNLLARAASQQHPWSGRM